MGRLAWMGLVSLLAACGGGDDDDDLAADAAVAIDAAPPDAALSAACINATLPGAEHRQYVIDKMTLPISVTQAQQLGLDLDGDPQGRPDNALGQILSTLASQASFSAQQEMDAAIADGTSIQLLDLDTATPEVRMFLGGDCDSPRNPTDNFDGDELFHVRDDDPGDPALPATLTGDDLEAGPGSVTVELILVAGSPIPLPLRGVRLEGVFAVGGVTDARLGGAILEADIDAILIPQLAEQFQATVDAECPGGDPPACCPAGSDGETFLELFDVDMDCVISEAEVRNNDLIAALFSPDVDLFDGDGNFNPRVDGVKDSLSLGIGLRGVTARFELPE